MCNQKLELPTGRKVSPQERLTAVCLLDIKSEFEVRTSSKLLKVARALALVRCSDD